MFGSTSGPIDEIHLTGRVQAFEACHAVKFPDFRSADGSGSAKPFSIYGAAQAKRPGPEQ
jgi:hypothetical protein